MLPPSGPILLGLGGCLLLRWRRTPGLGLLIISVTLSYSLSIPLTSSILNGFLQVYPPFAERDLASFPTGSTAIVVLAGGLWPEAPEYEQGTLHPRTLGRLRYGARLARASNLPVLVSGGVRKTNPPHRTSLREAELMAQALVNEYDIRQVRLEANSRNTWENAVNSTALLRKQGIQRVILVTQAAHMVRAAEAFAAQGLAITPAPTLFFSTHLEPEKPSAWLPSPSAVAQINYACHEWLGIWYYRLVLHRTSPPAQEGSLPRS